MYLEGEEIRIENVADREAADLAAMASDYQKKSPLPMLRKLEIPFTLGRASKDVITKGLAKIALEERGSQCALEPEKASELLDELYGPIDSPEDFATPLEQPTPL
jgi:hypothetical protein